MSFFEVENNSVDKKTDNSLWAERYRPDTIDDYICDDSMVEIVNNFIVKKDIPQLLFYGDAGSGKTTLSKIITNKIPCDVLYVNASDNTGVDFIRDKVRPFAAASGFHDLKIVILDEADFLSANAQASLRNLMETYSQNTRFILTCNYVEKIIKPLVSRCQVYNIEPPNKQQVALYLKNIFDKENVGYELDDIKTIINDFYPDIRKIVNYSQQISTSGAVKHIKTQTVGFDVKQKLISLIKEKSKSSFNDIRQLINDCGTKHFDDLYHELYEKIDLYSKNKELEAIIIIAEYSYQNAMVVDKEITFMACISKLLKI
jgi:replication factor C small subunit